MEIGIFSGILYIIWMLDGDSKSWKLCLWFHGNKWRIILPSQLCRSAGAGLLYPFMGFNLVGRQQNALKVEES